MEKQIEEMASLIVTNCAYKWCENCKYIKKPHCIEKRSAEKIYEAGYRKQSDWISVDEKLPDKSGRYLTWHGCYLTWHGCYYGIVDYSVEKQGWNITYCEDRETEIKNVTHWMPLPEAPKCGAE